jgi:vacuolar-type H+-ATPase subunit H
MDSDLLVGIIAAEKEIHKCLEDEKLKARDWIESVRRDAEEDFGRETAEIRKSSREIVETAKKEAENKAALILHTAERQAELIGKVDDDTLRKAIMRHLHKILPT